MVSFLPFVWFDQQSVASSFTYESLDFENRISKFKLKIVTISFAI